MNSKKTRNFERLIAPKSIAFFGGSDAEAAIKEAHRVGYEGEIWPVNPKRNHINGINCFRSVRDLPGSPDASFIAVPARSVAQILAELNALEAGGAVCYSAGFSEIGSEGIKLEKNLVAAAGEIVVVGPNCYGYINYLDKAAIWPFAHGGSCPGFGAAIITQSGMFSSDITMTRRSVPITHMVSVGNQAMLSIEDFINYLCDNPKVKAIGIHIEGIKNIKAFQTAAMKALTLNKPIVAFKVGVSRLGKSLTESHTGSLSGEDNFYDALFNRLGIIRVSDGIQFLETLKFLCISGIPKNNQMVGFTCSGGGATMLADNAEKLKLEFNQFDKQSTKVLKKLLPDIATVSNPLDYTTPIWGIKDSTRPVFHTALQKSRAQSAILVQDYPRPELNESENFYLNDATAFFEACKLFDKNLPKIICCTFPENMGEKNQSLFIQNNVSPIQGISEALTAVRQAINYGAQRSRLLKNLPKALYKVKKTCKKKYLSELESKILLKKNNINVPKFLELGAIDVNNVMAYLNFPVALKMIGPKLLHKTDFGAVKLGIHSGHEIQKEKSNMLKRINKVYPEVATNNFLLEEMMPDPIAELILGIQKDEQFGLILVLGSGGVLTELIQDSVSILLPTNEKEISLSIESLKIFNVLKGFRGGTKVNLKKLYSQIIEITQFFGSNKNHFESIEINPLFVYQDKIYAVDALIEKSE